MIRYLKRLSFRTKLLFIIFCCVALPTIFNMITIILSTSDLVKNQAIKNEEYTMDIAHTYLTQKYEEIIQIMNYIQFDEHTTQVIREGKETGVAPRDFLSMNRNLEYLSRNSNISVNIILFEKNKRFANHGFITEMDYDVLKEKGDTYLEGLPSFQSHWFNRDDEQADNQVIMIGRRLVDYSGQTVAYLFAGIDRDSIDKVLNKAQPNRMREYILLDAQNEVIYGDVKINKLNQEQFSEMKKNQAFFHEIDGENYLISQKDFGNKGWSVISFMPYSDVIKEVDTVYTKNVYRQLIGFLLLFVLLFYAVRIYTKPIHYLANTAKHVTNGNLSVRTNMARQDEIGELASTFDLMLERIQKMIEEITVEQEKKVKAEIAYLHAKIQPHFMYNVLNTIRMQMMHEKQGSKSAQSLYVFTQFLRGVYTSKEKISLRNEIIHTENYVKLINKMRRFPIQLTVNVDENLLIHPVPSFILQPLVENAAKHGDLEEFGHIHLDVQMNEQHQLMIRIVDNGIGAGDQIDDLQAYLSSETEMKEYGIGLQNIYQRLQLVYGTEFSMDVQNGKDGGFIVTLILPVQVGVAE